VTIEELSQEEVQEWYDGSCISDRAAGATRTRSIYFGTLATVADAEEVGVMLAWEGGDAVALDSQRVIQRIWSLQ